jgi:glutathione S-transferase
MLILYHSPMCPYSRQIRVMLREIDAAFDLVQEPYWLRSQELAKLNPACEVPVLVDKEHNLTIGSVNAIYEYLDEVYYAGRLLGDSPQKKAKVRQTTNWFNNKFHKEVINYILNEKILCFYRPAGEPNSSAIRAARHNIYYHLDYIGFLLDKSKWLAGDELTIADIAAASNLSVLDYVGDVPWQHNSKAKEWYAIIKSRPSFRPLLSDRVPGLNPTPHYIDLDF